MELRIALESDNNILWRVGAQAGPPPVAAVAVGRLIISCFRLWARTMVFKGPLDSLLKPAEWTYLVETVEESPQKQDQNGNWVVTSQAYKPRHVYVWFLRADKKDNQEANPLIFDRYDLRSCYLEFGARRYPDAQYNSSEVARIYSDLIGASRVSHLDSSSQLSPQLWRTCYPVYYFDIRYRDPIVDSTSQKLVFWYNLGAAPAHPYNVYALILSEAQAKIVKEGRELVVRR